MAEENKETYLQISDEDLIPFNIKDPDVKVELSPYVREHMDKWLQRYPKDWKQSGVFEALRVVQEENGGWLTTPLMDAVADYLGMSKIAVYEIPAFYTMYNLQPVGKHVIDVCTNISCSLNGAREVLEHIKKRLGIEVNETTKDGLFTLKEVECLGACVAPPACQIGKKYYENFTTQRAEEVITALSEDKSHGK